MTAEEYIRAGRLGEALSALQEAVRDNPADARQRIFLFQLFSVLGDWERALTQLQVLAQMDADSMLLAQIYRPVILCEVLRGEIFAGKRAPVIFGEPVEWLGLLVQANDLIARSEFPAAQELRDKAFEAAPANPGKINDQPFAWLADADTRLGPVLEVMMEGQYYWVPFCRIRKIAIEPPTDLRNLVWMPAQLTWTNGGAVSAFLPTRYPTTESSTDDSLRLARRTQWVEKPGGHFFGLGQRLLATDGAEFPLLDVRQIEFGLSVEAPVTV